MTTTTNLHMPNDSRELRDIIRGYVTAMLWAETDDNDEPLEDSYSENDFAPETIVKIREVCERFAKLVSSLNYSRTSGTGEYTDAECAGHDLWLTSRGHGAGFWESGRWEILGESGEWEPIEGRDNPLCAACYAAAGRYAESPYIGDDGLLYL